MRSWRAALALSLATAAVAVLVALAARADGPPQRLAASTTTASPAPTPTAEATPEGGGAPPGVGRSSPPPPPTPVRGTITFSTPEPEPLAECSNGTAVASPADNPGLVSDCSALLRAKDALRGTAALNWSATLAIASWEGVTVRSAGGARRVTGIKLRHKGIDGAIPAALGDLTELTGLHVGAANRLTGPIPPELGKLTKLTEFSANGNGLTGELPAGFANLTELSVLNLKGNRLTAIPDLSRLTKLNVLVLRRTGLTGGIPSWLGNVTSLTLLDLYGNGLTGGVPAELAGLTRLRELWLGQNSLTGCLPASLRSVARHDLASLGLADCTSTPTPTPTPEPTPEAIPQVRLGDYLDAGTYAIPGRHWIFDVPEGMRLQHHWRADGGDAVSYGFLDHVTTASFSFNAKPASIEFWIQAEGSTPAARELASGWLDTVEASVRRPPDYAEPVRGAADEGPGTNPDGIPYLRDYNHSKEMFAGGLTYATPDDEWLVDVPSGLSVMFWAETQVMPFGGEAVETYSFDTAGMQSSIAIDKATGEIAARFGDVNAQLDTLAASFRRRSASP